MPAAAADESQEIAARAMLGEAEKLIELALPKDALPVIDKLQSDYPGTEAAEYGELRRSECYLFMGRLADALETSQRVVADHPGTILACWAQSIAGQALVDSGKVQQGIVELFKVRDMLPDESDLGPLNQAQGVIGRVYNEYVESRRDVEDPLEALGVSRSDGNTKAKVLAMLAMFKARQGRVDLVNPLLYRMEKEYGSEAGEIAWARLEAARLLIQHAAASGSKDFLSSRDMLSSALDSAYTQNSDQAAKCQLEIAKFYARHQEMGYCIDLLQDAAARFASTQASMEISYELGNCLYRQNRHREAKDVLVQLVQNKPTSGYAAPTLYCVGTQTAGEGEAAVDALIKLAEGNYDIRWRGLAMWRLGEHFARTDRDKAQGYFVRAIEAFEQALSEQVSDQDPNWRKMLQTRIDIIASEIQRLR